MGAHLREKQQRRSFKKKKSEQGQAKRTCFGGVFFCVVFFGFLLFVWVIVVCFVLCVFSLLGGLFFGVFLCVG